MRVLRRDACSQQDELWARDSKNANSALIVTVHRRIFRRKVFLRHCFSEKSGKDSMGIWKRQGSRYSFEISKEHRKSTEFGEVVPQMKGAYVLADVRSILPKEIGDSIEEGVTAFGRKIKVSTGRMHF